MKRKFLIVLLGACLAIVSAFALTACGKVSVELSFKVDGETYATVSTKGNETIAMPKDPEKAGYVFDGWYWDEGTWERPFTANSLLDTPLSSNMSVYAKFSEPHDHTFSTEWEHDETHHWHKATCGHFGEKQNYEEHKYNGSTCTVCGYYNPAAVFSFELVGNAYTVTAYNGSASEAVMPSTYQGKEVTVIGRRAFYDCKTLRKITLPKTLIEIGEEAFGYCNALKEADIAACTRLKDNAFIGCTKLAELTFPNGLTSIGEAPFEECTSLKKVTLESGSVSEKVFAGNTDIQEIVLGEGVTNVAQNAFKGCRSLKRLTMPEVTEAESFQKYYFGLETYMYIMSGSGADGLYPSELRGYKVGTTIFQIPVDGADWYYAKNGLNYSSNIVMHNGKEYVYGGEPISVSTWENCYEITVNVSYKRPKLWSANFYYTPDSPLEKLTVTNQMISTYNKVFHGLKCEKDIVKKFPIESVTVNGVNDVFIDEFSVDDYTFNVKHTDGLIEVFPLTWDNIKTDPSDFDTTGEKTLTVEYGGVSSDFPLNIKLHKFEGLSMDDLVTIYNGSTKSLAVKGAPTDAAVTYKNNNQTKVGEYVVTATVKKRYYETVTLTATLYIRQSRYNITYVLGEDGVTNSNPREYTFGKEMTLQLPENNSWEFLGWYTDSGFTNKFTGITASTYGDLTVYAKWRSIFTTSGNAITGLTDYGKTLAKIAIPASINGASITTIGEKAFYDCSSLTSITIPNSVTSIGNRAFWYCSSLTSITIGNRVTSIGEGTFGNCSNLTSVTIPDSVTSIGSSAFFNCSSLTSITIGNSVASIGYSAFNSCSGLTSVYITDITAWYRINFNSDSSNPLYYAHNLYLKGDLITKLEIPSSVTSIGSEAFINCSSLTSITIPNSVTSIGSSAFSGCSSLTSITIPNSVTSIGSSAFSNCRSLTSITIPDSVTSIGYSAFYGCSGLTSVTIPNSVTSIGDRAFYNCRSLTSVTIGNSVTSIGSQAFQNCPIETATIPTIAISSVSKISLKTVVITSGGSITEKAFEYCRSLTSITIGNSITSIGDRAFLGCSNLTSIMIPSSVTSIGNDAFYDCSNLTSITIPNGVTSIGDRAFSWCSSLTSVTIGNSVISIGNKAFSDCSSLKTIYCEAESEPSGWDSEWKYNCFAEVIWGYKG